MWRRAFCVFRVDTTKDCQTSFRQPGGFSWCWHDCEQQEASYVYGKSCDLSPKKINTYKANTTLLFSQNCIVFNLSERKIFTVSKVNNNKKQKSQHTLGY